MSLTRRSAPAVFALLLAARAGADDGREIRRAMPLDPDGRVSIETYKGSVTVTGWDQPRVEILARIEPDGTDSSQAEKVRLTEVDIEASGKAVRIRSDYSRVKSRSFWSHFGEDDQGTLPFVRYTVRMPRRGSFQLKDHKSRIGVSGLDGDVDLNSYKGIVELADLPGVRLKTYKGEVRARFDRFERDSSFETYKGDILVELPARAGFDLEADTGRRGDLDNDFGLTAASDRDDRDGRYRGPVNGGGPNLRLETYKGRFRIRQR
jgi:hypothetical protein